MFYKQEQELENPMLRDFPPDVGPMWLCDRCQGDIYKGEEYYNTNGLIRRYDVLCEDCFKEICVPILMEDFMVVAGEE